VMPCRSPKNEIAASGSSKQEKSTLSGLPVERLNRNVTISFVGRPPNQNTYENVEFWRLSYNTSDRWVNPVMGWVASDDPIAKNYIKFRTLEDAKAYCQELGLNANVSDMTHETSQRPTAVSSYEMNFAYKRPEPSPFDDE